jgi:hypothetical protein
MSTATHPGGDHRVCSVCGRSLKNHRKDARVCSDSCRAEASRLRRILSNEEADGYRSVDQRIRARQRRTKRRMRGK